MTDSKGDKLFVNLGASKARRRLKGFGHGVRKVQSAGRNRAVIVHTATGRHLRELESVFSDVGFSATEDNLSEPIENLPNIGPSSAAWLREVGIQTIAELERVGPVTAYRLVKERQPAATLHLLWSLEAGLLGKKWQDLAETDRERLNAKLHEA